MIESPSLIMNMTAKENMKAHRMMRGISNVEIEDELLRLVGLGDTGEKRLKTFHLV